MPYNAGERKDVRRAEKTAKLIDEAHARFLSVSMSTTEGRRWFHALFESCHIFNDPFSGNALLEAYSKGERNVGLRLFADVVAVCPDQYIIMMHEAQIRNLTNERSVKPARHDDSADTDSALDERSGLEIAGRDDQGSEPADIYGDQT
jgi:hypothetical protein